MIVFINISPPHRSAEGHVGDVTESDNIELADFHFQFSSSWQHPNVGQVKLTKSLERALAPRLQTLSRFKDLFFSIRGYLRKVSPLPSTALRYRSINFFPRKTFITQAEIKFYFLFMRFFVREFCVLLMVVNTTPPPSRGKFNLLMTLAKTNQVQTKPRTPYFSFDSGSGAPVTTRLGGARGDGALTRDTNLEGE